jgi:hypothetical protein
MRLIEPDYDAFAEERFPNMKLVRAWADCKIWSAGVEQALLVLVDTASKRVALFEYDTLARREKEIQLVLHLPDGEGGAGAGVPAFLNPRPPSPSARNAQALPMEENANL